MVKTYLKTFARTFLHNKARLISIILMVLVSIGFSAGIGMATDKMDFALDNLYRESNVSDFIVKSTRETGFTDSELEALASRYEGRMEKGGSLEFKDAAMEMTSTAEYGFIGEVELDISMQFEGVGEGVSKVYFSDMPPTEHVIDRLQVLETCERPQDLSEDIYDVYVERATDQLRAYPLGSMLTAELSITANTPFGAQQQSRTMQFYVRGTIFNPLHMAVRDDVSIQFTKEDGEAELLDGIFYLFEPDLIPAVNDVYLTLPRGDAPVMCGAYEADVTAEKAALEELLTADGVREAEVLTLFENFSFRTFHEYAGKIEGIGYVMMAVFLLVTLLIVLSTMTRFLDEERAQLACLSTLGYSPLRIVSKYLLFAFIGTVIGAFGAYFAGMGLAYIVYINFTWNYTLPAYPPQVSLGFYFIVSSVILVATMLATLFAGLKKTRERPAEQLRPKAPKPGKKVVPEYIPLLWNRLSFKYKSSLRNVLRYRMRFFMTVVAVMASTALVLAGLAVLDCCIFQDIGTSAMIGVAVVVLIFAALLNFVVIYTLTNINISERERELATLMVLGYQDREVTAYVYREIYVTSAIGILFGLPFGCLLCLFIFDVMAFGSIPGMGWYVWVCAPIISLIFTFLVTLMLSPKITRIRMNESLKAIE